MRYLICYDIEDDRSRRKIAELLEGYGIRVQKSVFELSIDKKELEQLIKKLEELADGGSVRLYHLCGSCAQKSFALFDEADPFDFERIIFF